MDIRLVIFLAFTSVTLISNTMLIWFAYRGFANAVMKLTDTARQFQGSRTTADWLKSFEEASAKAATLTEKAKQKMKEYQPTLDRAQVTYGSGLAKVDSAFASVASGVSGRANEIHMKIEKPASAIAAFAAGLRSVTTTIVENSAEDDE